MLGERAGERTFRWPVFGAVGQWISEAHNWTRHSGGPRWRLARERQLILALRERRCGLTSTFAVCLAASLLATRVRRFGESKNDTNWTGGAGGRGEEIKSRKPLLRPPGSLLQRGQLVSALLTHATSPAWPSPLCSALLCSALLCSALVWSSKEAAREWPATQHARQLRPARRTRAFVTSH